MTRLALAVAFLAAAGPPAVAKAPGLVVSHGGKLYVGGVAIGKGTEPVWSADGKRIAFVRDGIVCVARPDGSGARRLTTRTPGYQWPASSPAWSPDGRRIAFTGTRDIMTVDVATTKVTRITRSEESWRANYTPAYSPDGKRIAFSRSTNAFNSDIFVMNADGTKLRRLTRTKGTDTNFAEEHGPTWSPDGKTIVFVSNREPPSWELWAIGADGRNERRITKTTRPRQNENLPRFSKDGMRLLYAHDGRIATVGLDGAGVREFGLGTSADWRS
jgi:Tol biopolymer transport system component